MWNKSLTKPSAPHKVKKKKSKMETAAWSEILGHLSHVSQYSKEAPIGENVLDVD